MRTTSPRSAPELAALDTRERLVRVTSRLMQRQGYDGTGVKQIAQEATATLGSVYHHFPGGKRELAVAAIRHGDREFADLLRQVFAGEPDPARAVEECARLLVEGLRDSDWVDGCPVTATALGMAGRLPDIQEAAAEAFEHWRGLVYDALRASGVADDRARDLASTVVSTLEGAELAAQVSRSPHPLEVAGRHLAHLISTCG